MQQQATPSDTGTAYGNARAAVHNPEAMAAASRSYRMVVWALLKAQRGQEVRQSNLNRMPVQGFGR
ncbi:hypothetical protein EU805_01670 [Salipiger sp. IMCC34102]|uniref:hypothetical protein n=1 Tax=Salipiger sp. IMCC34102 TaxID=2510647 RepID=UPI00101CAF89|nr:hypothetical protein [Salipiger sp. IMCC34102]RYH04106.1 hypothetical protein EU805_01670 [Salipiger sp. IMCC34102]